MEGELLERIRGRLEFLYGGEAAAAVLPRIERLAAARIPRKAAGWSGKDALLITYGDSLLGREAPLRELHGFLRRRVGGRFSFVHLLPFYPSTSDDGFSVADYREVRPDLGDWEDIEALGADYRLVFDAVVNHVSAESRYVRGFLAGEPAYRDFCISAPRDVDASAVVRPRTLPLLHAFSNHWLWTTFSRDQVDLNFGNPEVLLEMLDVLLFYAARGASALRLDAIPYLWKKPGTSCVHLPETHAVVKLFRDVLDAAAPHVLLLTETNAPHRDNISYFGDGGDEAQMIYNFALAPLIVWALHRGDARALTEWARSIERISPRATYLNITATHDGIGLRATEGVLSDGEREELARLATDRGGAVSRRSDTDGSEPPYELNISYFDAVDDPVSPAAGVKRFLVSQAIPMALMGVPGVYIHSLLGSRNDLEGVKRTGRARSINRAQVDAAALEAELLQPGNRRRLVFEGVLGLLKTRSGCSAFHPEARQEVLSLHPGVFALRRFHVESGEEVLALHSVSPERVRIAGEPPLEPYEVRWLKRTRVA